MNIAYLAKWAGDAELSDLASFPGDTTVVCSDRGYFEFFTSKGYNTISVESYFEDNSLNFTHTIGNPPYSSQLHLEFLARALEISDSVHLVHPSGWLTRTDKKIERRVKELLDGRVYRLTIFTGYPVFKAQFMAPLVKTQAKESHSGPIEVVYANTGNTYYIDSIWDFPSGYWEPTDINLQLRDKIYAAAAESNLLELRTSDINAVPLNLPTVIGDFRSKVSESLFCRDTYLFLYPNSDIYTAANNEGKFYSLNSEEERDNLVSYLKTKFARFALALNKANSRNNVSRYVEHVPLPPIDKPWTDESVCEFYNLTSEEWAAIDNFIPDYYS